MEYVVQAKDLDDMKSWISVIRHCTDFPLDDGSTEIDLNPVQLRPRLTSAPASDSPRIRHCESLPATRGANRVTPQRSSGHFGRVIINDAVDTVSVGSASGAQSQGQQQLHRSLSTGHDVAYRVRNSNNAAIAASMNDRRMIGGSQTLDVDSARMMGGGGAARTISPSLRSRANLEYRRSGDLFASFTSTLHEFPWFHGLMSRSDAAMLILQAGRDGHGLFIVRQSETRLGEYVLTFNCYGRAKHIRLNICSDGKAQVLNLSFGSIFDVLEFYRQNEIPFENGGSGANFLAAEHQQQQMGISTSGSLGHYVIAWPPHNRSRRSRHDPCDPRDYMSHDGSVRIRTRSLERMAVRMSRNAAAAQLATSDNDAAVSSAALTPHRPENSYQMFLMFT
uniref:SH2 domain-containing protein n=1 Tax=Romanomermis culicivorax TaxID=13658 RepID=A0A915J8Q9_ROMCU